ncbi:MAG TPA: hypothetical protein VHN37_06900 [Actinomycetota bacterium]|nr:hypothetical protein [Actinomycetota bacterium]
MSPLVRKHSLTGGAIDALATAAVYEDWIVTAVRTGGGALKLIVWKNDGTELQRAGEVTVGPVEDLSACRMGYARVATACRGPSGKLSLALWQVTPEGDIHLTDSAGAGVMSKAAPVGLGETTLATPLIDSDGNLKVIAWAASDDGELTRCGDASGGRVSVIATDRWADGRFVTALRNASGDLELILWVVLPSGEVERLGEATAGSVSAVDVIRNNWVFSLEAQEFITAVRDADSRLKLIAWEARSDGAIERLGDLSGPYCSKPSLAWLGITRHVVAYREADGDLRVQCFYWGAVSDPANPMVPTGDDFELRESAGAGAVSMIGVETAGTVHVATAVRNGSGNLQVILWALE